MATFLVASIVLVPLALLVGDLFRRNHGDDQRASYGQQLNG